MLLLGLDTSTPAVTVALHDGDSVLARRTTVDAKRHGELLAPAVSAVLTEAGCRPADLTAVAVGVGPGPYTGLRVGIVTALALGDALSVPVHGVGSLDVIAAAVDGAAGPVTVVTDARRREVFWATYDDDRRRTSGPAVGRPSDAAALVVGAVVGAGAAMYPEAFGPGAPPLLPDAGSLCALVLSRLADGDALEPAVPIYLRRPDATVPGPPKPVLAS